MTQKIVGGYSFREQIARAQTATQTTRESLDQIINSVPNQYAAVLVAKAALAQTVILEALREIETIAGRETP